MSINKLYIAVVNLNKKRKTVSLLSSFFFSEVSYLPGKKVGVTVLQEPLQSEPQTFATVFIFFLQNTNELVPPIF